MQNFVNTLARMMAILGGLVLSALIVMVCLSVLGRGGNTFANWDALEAAMPGLSAALLSTGIGPVPGDFEVVEAGIAFAIFAFLPLCQLKNAHATVDVFTSLMPKSFNTFLKAFWEILLTLAILLITWRLGVGLMDKIDNGETTFILGFPKWWGYAASFVAALVASFVALYCATIRTQAALKGQPSVLDADEAR